MSSSSDCSTQITPFDLVDETSELGIVPLKTMLDMLDKMLGSVSSKTVADGPVHCLNASHEKLFPLSNLKILETQLDSTLKLIQAQAPESVINTPHDQNPKDYWLGRLKQTMGLVQAKIVEDECK